VPAAAAGGSTKATAVAAGIESGPAADAATAAAAATTATAAAATAAAAVAAAAAAAAVVAAVAVHGAVERDRRRPLRSGGVEAGGERTCGGGRVGDGCAAAATGGDVTEVAGS